MQLTGRSYSTVIAECRQCGTMVEVETLVCPECDHDGIAIHQFDYAVVVDIGMNNSQMIIQWYAKQIYALQTNIL
jgi:RNA polymerase subunit RPABC4/transcription elongation factor Spt4